MDFKKLKTSNLKSLIQKKQIEGTLQSNLINLDSINKLKTLKEEEDLIISQVIDEVWENYNDDGNEHLDREEMERFIYITLIENGDRQYETIHDLREDPQFKYIFDQFDEDGSGTIAKEELADFIKKVSGL